MKRASYHTTLKELVSHELLPNKYLKDIPRSNIHRWRNDDYQRYVGSDINQIADKHTELIQTLNHYPRMFIAYGHLVKTLVQITSQLSDYSHVIRNAKTEIVNAIDKSKGIISIEKAVQVFNISKSTFHTWVIDVKLQCSKSYFKKCNSIYSNQVTPMEVKAAKAALMNPRNLHWPIKSIHFEGIKDGSLTISLNTIYKINKLLAIRKTRSVVKKKKRHPKGIRATLPNRIWHTDITVVKAINNKKYYVYFVIDNFSRKILSYAVKEAVSGLVTKGVLEEAYLKAKAITINLNVTLIVDGGPENNNIVIDNFISRSEINIQKLVALRDINFSNSMIERVNRVFKYRYLFPKSPRDLKHLKRILKYFIDDYNNRRPHGQLDGLTPDQAWIGLKPTKKETMKVLTLAREKRLAYNRENKCNKCLK
ncbi:MAG: hypothetical protein COB15_12330 [Flavobacteriales bacterium]|nr:MAG: hypothetical protein COB15_12330 [Flavobacteriales bacterium]